MVCFYMEKAKQASHNCTDLKEHDFCSACFEEDLCYYSNKTAAEQMDLSVCDSFTTVSVQ